MLDNSGREAAVSATTVGCFCDAFAPGWKLVHAIAWSIQSWPQGGGCLSKT